MTTQIQFTSGDYISLTATRNFSLGDSGVRITAGTEVLFDGIHAIIEGNSPVNLPKLKGAYTAGWLVSTNEYDADDPSLGRPKSAGIRVRNADGGNGKELPREVITTVDAEEQEVGQVEAHAQQTRDRNIAAKRTPQRRASVTVEDGDQEGVPVRTLTTPAKSTTNLDKAGEAIRKATNVQIKPGVGKSREEVLAEMPEDEREEYLSQIEAGKAGKPGAARDASGREIVGRVASPKVVEKDGFVVTNSIGRGSTPVEDLSGSTGTSKVSVTEVDGIKITNTNGPKKLNAPQPAPTGAKDPRRTIARAICSDFPDNYDFNAPLRKKIARLQADFDDRPDVIRAVAAAETDGEVKARLVQDFPEAFS